MYMSNDLMHQHVREIHASSWTSHHKTAALAPARTWSSSVTIVTILTWLVLDVSDPW